MSTNQKIKTISAALYQYSVADFGLDLLQKISIEDMIEIINHSKNKRAEFRAAWALEHLLLNNISLLTLHKDAILDIYINTENWSVLRSITKIIIALIANALKFDFILDEQKNGYLLDKSFKILENQDCPIAVRCNIYDLIYLSNLKEKWVLSELKTQIYFDLEKSPSPALLSRGNKLLKKLKGIS